MANNGIVRHDEFEHLADNGWTVFAEHRAWGLDFATALTNVRGREIVFGSPTTNGRPWAGYGGLLPTWANAANGSPTPRGARR